MSINVNAYVAVSEGCPIAMSVHKSEHVEIICGWIPDRSFEFSLHREALRALIELGTDALRQMDAESTPPTSPLGH